MANYTIRTNIKNLDDLYNFRTKVFDVVSKLSEKEIVSSRLSSGISSHLSKVVKEKEACSIFTEVAIDQQKAVLKFKLPTINGYSNQLNYFFDQVQPVGNNELRVSKNFTCLFQPDIILSNIEEILSQKTKEELMHEVEAQNIELQLSFENLKKTNTEKARMENELNVAKEIQMSMLPVEFPNRPDIDVYAKLIPAREVGGDFYDFYFLDDKHMGIAVGDVSGKGVPAALMMAVCKALLKSKASSDYSTANIINHVNTEMAKDNKNYMFVTVFMSILNTETGELCYTNAGHNPTYIKKKNGGVIKLTDLHGPVLAAMEGMDYSETKVQVEAGDVIFGYTDGIPEAHNVAGELFSDQRLSDLLEQSPFLSTKETVESIVNATLSFEGEADQFDDITALCVEYKGKNNG